MVLLTLTPGAVRAIAEAREATAAELAELQHPSEPSLAEPAEGKPVSHSQLIDLSKLLKKHDIQVAEKEEEEEPVVYTLDYLLKGSKVYIPPPPPKKEPTPEFKALMQRLRREEEARAYERMISPPPPSETFTQCFPASPSPFSTSKLDVEDDDLSYEEVHRQIILIINVLVSIIACSVFIWVAARHWSAPKRLGLSMGGSGVVAIAEVIIYSGYVRKVREAKVKEKKKPEIKEIIESWIIDGSTEKNAVQTGRIKEMVDDGIRFRKGKHR